VSFGTSATYKTQFNIFKIDLPNKKIISLNIPNIIPNYDSTWYGSFYLIFNNKIFYYYDGNMAVYKF
jgi:hypothetical protein